jgi:hypothetical protein
MVSPSKIGIRLASSLAVTCCGTKFRTVAVGSNIDLSRDNVFVPRKITRYDRSIK